MVSFTLSTVQCCTVIGLKQKHITVLLELPNSLFVEVGVVSEPFKHTCTSN